MAVTGFSHYNLRAGREMLERLRRFYVDVVGLEEGPRPLGSYGYWLFAGGRDVLHLSETHVHEPARRTDVAGTFDHAAFLCEDLAATESRLHELGISYRRVEVRETRRVQLFFRDPAGNGVELNFAA